MKDSKEFIIPWIEEACDENRYPGLLYWIDKERKIFFLAWIHKSSENWDKSKSKVFEDWAVCKKKLGLKDDRDLKAAFRNALRSKKSELKLIEKSKSHRHWQIISKTNNKSPTTSKNKKSKKSKQKKEIKKYDRSSTNEISEQSTASTSYTGELSSSSPLPPYHSLFHDSPCTSFQQHIYSENYELHGSPISPNSSTADSYRGPSPLVDFLPKVEQSYDLYNNPSSLTSHIIYEAMQPCNEISSYNMSLNFLEEERGQVVPMSTIDGSLDLQFHDDQFFSYNNSECCLVKQIENFLCDEMQQELMNEFDEMQQASMNNPKDFEITQFNQNTTVDDFRETFRLITDPAMTS